MVPLREGLGIEPQFSPLLHFFYSSVCETSREPGSEAVLRERLFYSTRGPEAASVLRGFGGGLDPKSHTLGSASRTLSELSASCEGQYLIIQMPRPLTDMKERTVRTKQLV